MRAASRLLLCATVLVVCAGPPLACKKATDPLTRKIAVRYTFAAGGITAATPRPEFRCVAYKVEVTNKGYDRVELDWGSFTLEVEGKPVTPAEGDRCRTVDAPTRAKLADGQSWRATIPFEQPLFDLEARILFSPKDVNDGLAGRAVPKIDYVIAPGL